MASRLVLAAPLTSLVWLLVYRGSGPGALGNDHTPTRSAVLTRPIFCTSGSERVISQPGAVKLVLRQGYRACVETRFSWLEIKRDHDPLQNSGVSIFAESPVREFAELAFLI